ncbi:MAG: hypothetical protein UH103_08235 [Paludibacteraceae bacterium]|nr:hypothetical protein [Paludibacteraceae bacterium]
MKTKLFYLSFILILFCSCEERWLCNCDRKNEPLELGGRSSRFIVVELKNEDLINNIYVVPDDTKTYNEFVNTIPNSLNNNPCPFVHIVGNNYLVNWNWLVSYNFFDSLDDNYIISNKWDEWYTIDAIKEKKVNNKLIKRVKFILAHTINDYIKNKNLDIIINEYFADNFNYLGNSPDKRAFIITEEKWNNFSQEEKERYLEIFDSYNKNYSNAIEALKYVLNEKDSDKYFIYRKYIWE